MWKCSGTGIWSDKNGIKSDPEENDIQRDAAKYDPAPAMDEVILKDKRRLVV